MLLMLRMLVLMLLLLLPLPLLLPFLLLLALLLPLAGIIRSTIRVLHSIAIIGVLPAPPHGPPWSTSRIPTDRLLAVVPNHHIVL